MKIFSVSIYSKCVPWINHVIHNMKAKKVSLQIIFLIPFLIKIMIFIATIANFALKQLNNKTIFWKELRKWLNIYLIQTQIPRSQMSQKIKYTVFPMLSVTYNPSLMQIRDLSAKLAFIQLLHCLLCNISLFKKM